MRRPDTGTTSEDLVARSPGERGDSELPARASDATTHNGTVTVPSIDGFRGLAVLWVVLGHCWNELGGHTLRPGPLKYIFTSSYYGVDMLFVVSGFVLFLPAVTNAGSIGDIRSYALRRAARIVPAFYIAMILSFFVARSLGTVRGGVGEWISHLFFLHQYAHPIKDIGFGVDGAMWTMSVEVIFYVLLPFVAGWYSRRPLLGLVVAFWIADFWYLLAQKLDVLLPHAGITWNAVGAASERMTYTFPSYAAHFALGMTAAWAFVRLRERLSENQRRPLALATALAAVVGVAAIAHLKGWDTEHGVSGIIDHRVNTFLRAGLFATMILAFSLLPKGAQWPVRNRVSRMLGTVSYGVYLSHMPMILLLIPALGLHVGTTNVADLWLLALAVVPLTVSIGITSYVTLEEPIRRWARRRRKASRSRGTAPSPRAAALARTAVAALYHDG